MSKKGIILPFVLILLVFVAFTAILFLKFGPKLVLPPKSVPNKTIESKSQQTNEFSFKNSIVVVEELKNPKSGYYDGSNYQLALIDISSNVRKDVKKISGDPQGSYEAEPKFSPDKSRLVFTDNNNLYLLTEEKPDKPTQITTEGAPYIEEKYWAVQPSRTRWSRDSSKLIYYIGNSNFCTHGPCEEKERDVKEGWYTVDKNGGDKKFLTDKFGDALGNKTFVDWGLDNQTLILTQFDEAKKEFMTIFWNINDGSEKVALQDRRLTNISIPDTGPFIAYGATNYKQDLKVVYTLDKNAFVQGRGSGGTSFLGTDGPATWSPGGNKLVIWKPKIIPSEINNWRYLGDIIVQDLTGAGSESVLVSDNDKTDVYWSKDGKNIIYSGVGIGIQLLDVSTKQKSKLNVTPGVLIKAFNY